MSRATPDSREAGAWRCLIRPAMTGCNANQSTAMNTNTQTRLPGKSSAEHDMYMKLSEREREVLAYIARGFSAPEIGVKMLISPKTVDSFKHRINEKLCISHRSQYVDFALKLGLLS
jgi:DNA-binding NarL/FixJ family response regulator